MAPNYKIALIQLYSEPLQIEANFVKASDYIRSAASQGAKLAVLPEYHLTGWAPQESKFAELAASWEVYLKKYQGLAKECDINIVPGTIVEKHEGEKGDYKLLNVAYFIGNNGSILGRYVKTNLWHPERDHLTNGIEEHEPFETPMGSVGLLICWDLAFNEAFRELIMKGARIIIIPSFWLLVDGTPRALGRNPHSEAVFLENTVICRAFENTCAVVFVNAGGPASGGYAGLSQVSLPLVGDLGKLRNDEDMSIVDVDMAILADAEANYKIREDLGREGWHYDYRHVKGRRKSFDSL